MITSITLRGFKSFAERTRLEFGPGVTAVIGPNGSGKSNVVEALRWVSHQARARELRAARATELIFHGSAGDAPGRSGKAALGLAEVQVELRTENGERLHLSRRIYRDGTAEQDIMGHSARARDVQSALRGTGLGSGGLAVIGQGEVGGVVQAEGPTLLAYVQEAAGLSRSVAARRDTAAQLLASQSGLAQVRLLEAELEGRTRRLELGARAAARSRQLSLQSFALQDALARARHLAALDELTALRARVARLGSETQAMNTEVQQAARALEDARERVIRAREERQAHAQTLELYQAAGRSQAQAEVNARHLDRDLQAVTAGLSTLELNEPDRAPPDLAGLQVALSVATRDSVALTRTGRELETALRQVRGQAGLAAQQRAARSAQQQTLQGEVRRVRNQMQLEASALEETRTEGARLNELAAVLERKHAGTLLKLAALQESEQGVKANLQRLQAEVPPLKREQERLEVSLHSYSRYGEGPRNALRSDHAGIVGSVADVLTVPAEHETAVGAALGRRLEQVVVQTADDAREIIDLLKRSGGRATFLPLDLLRHRPRRDAALLGEPGVLGNLSDLCLSDPPLVGQNLLSDTLLLGTLQAATSLARRHPNRPRLVTVDGELIEPGGALSGGRLRDGGPAVLSDQRRFSELQDELAALQQRQVRLTRDLAQVAGDLEDAATSESVARAARDQIRDRAREATLQLTGLEASHRSLSGQHESLVARLGTDPQQEPETDGIKSLETLESRLEANRAAVDQANQRERDFSAQLGEGRSLEALWTGYRSAVVRQRELTTSRAELQKRQREMLSQLQQLSLETLRYGSALGELDPHALARTEAQRDHASALYSTLIGRQNRTAAELEEARLTLARREGSGGSVPDGALLAGTAREWNSQLTAVQHELEGLGPVNPAAAEELAAEDRRLQELIAQRLDVEQAEAELTTHLDEMDRTQQQATSQALARVGRAFAEYSGELLGGTGELGAEQDPGGRLTGLRLTVQPKGKRTRSLTLLSAGERTMAGLAFLFALGHAPEGSAAGLPLAVLDEVDAPLDEANIRRFTRFLTVFAARGSQFLLVTHQKATMEVAAAIWGVTTDVSGGSQVLSIRQAEDDRPVQL